MNGVIVAGIGTGIGKTFIATILAEAMGADYWKPVQAGSLDYTDSDFVRQHISNAQSFIHPEAYRLSMPMSPHAAASIDGVEIEAARLSIPATNNRMVIEPAGGIMVPLSQHLLNIDMIEKWDLPVILVSRNYLGSINHSLLTVAALQQRKVRILGIIFNGEENRYTQDIIIHYTGLACIGHTREEENIDSKIVKHYASELMPKLNAIL